MKKLLILILIFISAVLFADCNVTVTSRLLECCVRDIGKEKVSVTCIVPVSACPGHYELSPKDIKNAKNADFVFFHGFEPYAKKLNNKNTFSVCKGNNMLVPKHYKKGLEYICGKLCLKDSKNAIFYRKNLADAIKKTDKINKEVLQKAKPLKGKNCICSVNNKPLMIYFGLNVTASYPVPDRITPKTWKDIYSESKGKHIDFCIDNLQSGEVSRQLAKDLKAKHTSTSNFPGGFKGTDTYEKCLKYNLDRILKIK